MNKKTIFIMIVLIGLFIGLGCGFGIPFILGKSVAVIHPHQAEAVEAIYATGTVEPTIMVPIASRTTAHLLDLSAQEGQTVHKGDVLARLEDSEQQAAINDYLLLRPI